MREQRGGVREREVWQKKGGGRKRPSREGGGRWEGGKGEGPHLGVGLDDVTDAGEELVALQAVLAVGQRALVAGQQGKAAGRTGRDVRGEGEVKPMGL